MMKKTEQILNVLLPLYVIAAVASVAGLVHLSRKVVSHDSAWQALRVGGATRAHYIAEAVVQMPLLLAAFILASVIILVLSVLNKTKKSQNNTSEHIP